jgi:spore germination cell wall hydrolase CwlJ-like protein
MIVELLSGPALLCAANLALHEARGESNLGKAAVVHVAVNRAKAKGKSVCAVAKEPRQFTNFSMKKKYPEKELTQAKKLVHDIKKRRIADPTRGATHFHHVKKRPDWTKKMRKTARIGQHVFWRVK